MANVVQLMAKINVQGVDRFVSDMSKSTSAVDKLAGHVNKVGSAVQSVVSGPMAALGAMVGAGGLALMAKGAFDTAVEFDSLKRGLTAVMGSSQAAEGELKRLIEVAKLPGLGLKEAMQGSTALQAAGMSADLAARSMSAFGNALATVGKGKADLDMVNLALTQLMNRQSGYGQEVRQLQERLPQIRRAMIDFYGTADSEAISAMGVTGARFVEDMTSQFAKLPRVTGGAQNAVENLSDAMWRLRGVAGGAIVGGVLPAVETLSTAISRMVDKGVLKNLFTDIVRVFGFNSLNSALMQGVAGLIAGLKQVPDVLRTIRNVLAPMFEFASRHIRLIATGLILWFGRSMITGVLAFAAAIMRIAQAIRAVGAGAAALQALGGPAGAARAATALAVGAGVYYGIGQMMPKLPEETIAGFDPEQFTSDRNAAMVTMMGLDAGGGGMIGTLVELAKSAIGGRADAQTARDMAGRNPAAETARNTARIAENTGKQLDYTRYALGGGELGRIGVTPVEFASARTGAGGRAVTVKIEGGRTIEQTLADLVAQTVYQMRRAGAV